jgi:hypothetical protein
MVVEVLKGKGDLRGVESHGRLAHAAVAAVTWVEGEGNGGEVAIKDSSNATVV